ncbi:hypothetical protein MNBD_ALPHA01-315 [hydrothermal vent metagenome]|uniref:Sulfotransferase domain-containing protein n=1 Tax=hydrothermal vent metagenome TaxID=652676 RepID=A0A3B0SU09_9ZZZZ
MIFLIGMPRSGTTWVAKIFDSNPDVLYHHEPDSVETTQDVPYFPKPENFEKLVPETRHYFSRLLKVRHLKSAGSSPVFQKKYLSRITNKILPGLIVFLKTVSLIFSKLKIPVNIEVPTFVRRGLKNNKLVDVMKSVSSSCRSGLVTRAFPEAKIIYIIRHPCGFVSSQLRGREQNYLNNVIYYSQLSSMDIAKERGWTVDVIKNMSIEEQLACTWVCLNEKALSDIEGQENCFVLLYEYLCNNPVEMSRRLLDFCNLDYTDQTDVFIKSSLNYSGGEEKYFQTVRDPKIAAEKWKQELTPEQIEKIKGIVSKTRSGDKFLSFYE